MGLLPLRLPPKPQPCEGYQTLCAALPLIVFLGSPFRRTRGSLSALHTNHPFVLQGVCPAGVGPGGQTVFILFQVDGQLAEKAALLRRAADRAFGPFAAPGGPRRSLRSIRPSTGPAGASRGAILNEKGRLRAGAALFSADVRKEWHRSDTHLRARSPPPFWRHSPAWPALCHAKMHGFAAVGFFPGRFFFFFAFFDRLKNHFFSTATQISQV